MTVIYADVLLFLNWVIDYLLLCGCARVLMLSASRKRLLLGAGVGALSSLLILLPPMGTWLSLLCKLLTASVTVPVAFRLRSWRQFCKAVVTLFILSALFAGVCNGLYLLIDPPAVLMQSGIVYVSVPPLLLLALTTASYGVLCVYDRFTRRRMLKGNAFKMDIVCRDTCVTLRAFFDSGHHLRDSFSGAPVIVARRESLGSLRSLTEPTTATAGACCLRYIPFSSVGGGGVLPLFRPTYVKLYTSQKTVTLDNVRVAVCDRLESDEYDALIGADIAVTGDAL